MKAYIGSRHGALDIVNVGTTWSGAITFTLQPINTWEMIPVTNFIGRGKFNYI
jgi:hypothetical protein